MLALAKQHKALGHINICILGLGLGLNRLALFCHVFLFTLFSCSTWRLDARKTVAIFALYNMHLDCISMTRELILGCLP